MRRVLSALGMLSLLAAYLLLELRWATNWAWSFDSDEAVFGLMALHIRAGAFPLFYYGQSYLGSLSSYVIAGLGYLFGAGPSTLKLSSVLFVGAGYALMTAALFRRIGRHALLFLALVVLMSQNAHCWTAKQRGPAELVFTIGLVLLVWTWWQDRRRSDRPLPRGVSLLVGLTLGFAFWNHLGIGMVIAPLVIQEVLTQPWYGEWRRSFSIRGFLTWTRGPHRLPGRAVASSTIAVILLAETAAAVLMLTGGSVIRTAWIPGLFYKLRYPAALGVAVLLALAMLYARLVRRISGAPLPAANTTGRRVRGQAVALGTGLLVGVLPAIVGFLMLPRIVQVPALARVSHIVTQANLLVTSSWPRVFGLVRNPAAWAIQLFLLSFLAVVISRRWRVWGRIARLQACNVGLVDVLCMGLVLNLLAFVLGDLAQGRIESYHYLAAAPLFLAAIASSLLAERGVPGRAARWVVTAVVGLCLTLNQLGPLRTAVSELSSGITQKWNRLNQEPSTDSLLTTCIRLDARHLLGSYSLSYRLTFLSAEEVIVAPTDGIDRYPEYTRLVEADPLHGYVATGQDSMLGSYRAKPGYAETTIGHYRLFTAAHRAEAEPDH